jgi:hypothetical protein
LNDTETELHIETELSAETYSETERFRSLVTLQNTFLNFRTMKKHFLTSLILLNFMGLVINLLLTAEAVLVIAFTLPPPLPPSPIP